LEKELSEHSATAQPQASPMAWAVARTAADSSGLTRARQSDGTQTVRIVIGPGAASDEASKTSMTWPSSAARRARTPTTSNDGASGRTPRVLTRPCVGRKPKSPHAAAGTRIEPAVSVPRPASASPAATAAAGPEDDPPVNRPGYSEFSGVTPSPAFPISEKAS
jgi:hypothetical protein